jgi:hypothetical protein
VLAVGGAPSIVWSPTELYRIISYLWFAVPVLADHLAQRLTADPFDPSDPS